MSSHQHPEDKHHEAKGQIKPVRVPKPAELLADILRKKIFSGEFPPGTSLPPERDLVAQSELSRSTVRQALSTLKQQGLLITKPGRSGGSIVSKPTEQDLVDSIDLYVQSQGWDSDTPTLIESREIIEPWCAALAADRRSEIELKELDHQNDMMELHLDDVPGYLEASEDWHITVATASHNTLLAAFMRANREAVLTGSSSSRFSDRSAREHTLSEHRTITDAIRRRSPATAYELMDQHVRAGEDPVTNLLRVQSE